LEPEPAEPPEPEEKASPAADEAPEGESVEGLVVHLNEGAGSYVVAAADGRLAAVHAPTAPRAGTEVEVPVRSLANGTYAEAGKRIRQGEAQRATLSGIVTYVDATPSAPAYAVSERGASMLVHVPPRPAGVAAPLPRLGASVTVAAEIDQQTSLEPPAEAPVPEPAAPPSCVAAAGQPRPQPGGPSGLLWQRRIEVEDPASTRSDFAGVLTAVCPESRELLLSADDVRESGRDLLFTASEELDLTRLTLGASILITARIADGTLAATGFADDEHRKGADNAVSLQGDFR